MTSEACPKPCFQHWYASVYLRNKSLLSDALVLMSCGKILPDNTMPGAWWFAAMHAYKATETACFSCHAIASLIGRQGLQ